MPSSLSDFEILHILGKGSFGTVFKVKHKASHVTYALKQVPLSLMKDKERDNALNEIRLLASLSSSYIIAYQDSFFDEYSNTLNMIMEYADNGDLEQLISRKRSQKINLTEAQAMEFILPIVKGLRTLHENHIMHRDLKLANIFLFKNGEVKIGDMNVSKVFKNDLKSTQTGTPYYACPEVWNNSRYDYKADIWSLGCLIYELVTFRTPFSGTSMKVVYDQVTSGSFGQLPMYLSARLSEVIKRALSVNPLNRPTIQDIEKAIAFGQGRERVENLDQGDLLSTICLSNKKSFNEMNLVLPKKNYFKKIAPLEFSYPKQPMNQKIVIRGSNDKQLKTVINNNKVMQKDKNALILDIGQLPKDNINPNKLFKLNYHYRHLNKNHNNNPNVLTEVNNSNCNDITNNKKKEVSQLNGAISEPNAVTDNLSSLKANLSENCYKKIFNLRKAINDNKLSPIENLIQLGKDNIKPIIKNNNNHPRPYSVNLRHIQNKSENMKCIMNNCSLITNQSTNDITLPAIKVNNNTHSNSNSNNKQKMINQQFSVVPQIILRQNNSSQVANVFNYYHPLKKEL